MEGDGIITRSKTQKMGESIKSLDKPDVETPQAACSVAQQQVFLTSQNEGHPSQTQFNELQRQVQTLIDLVGSRLPGSVPSVDMGQHDRDYFSDTKQGTSATERCLPQPYDGTVSWAAYKAQFQAVADQNRWNNQERAAQLIASLRGPAVEVLGHLPQGTCQDFFLLSEALAQRFGVPHHEEVFLAQFKNRKKTTKRDSLRPGIRCQAVRNTGIS